MSIKKNIFGYKVFNPDMTCHNYQFEIGLEQRRQEQRLQEQRCILCRL